MCFGKHGAVSFEYGRLYLTDFRKEKTPKIFELLSLGHQFAEFLSALSRGARSRSYSSTACFVSSYFLKISVISKSNFSFSPSARLWRRKVLGCPATRFGRGGDFGRPRLSRLGGARLRRSSTISTTKFGTSYSRKVSRSTPSSTDERRWRKCPLICRASISSFFS